MNLQNRQELEHTTTQQNSHSSYLPSLVKPRKIIAPAIEISVDIPRQLEIDNEVSSQPHEDIEMPELSDNGKIKWDETVESDSQSNNQTTAAIDITIDLNDVIIDGKSDEDETGNPSQELLYQPFVDSDDGNVEEVHEDIEEIDPPSQHEHIELEGFNSSQQMSQNDTYIEAPSPNHDAHWTPPSSQAVEQIDLSGMSQFFAQHRVVMKLISDETENLDMWNFEYSKLLLVQVSESDFPAVEVDHEYLIIVRKGDLPRIKNPGQYISMSEPFHAFSYGDRVCFIAPNVIDSGD